MSDAEAVRAARWRFTEFRRALAAAHATTRNPRLAGDLARALGLAQQMRVELDEAEHDLAEAEDAADGH